MFTSSPEPRGQNSDAMQDPQPLLRETGTRVSLCGRMNTICGSQCERSWRYTLINEDGLSAPQDTNWPGTGVNC